MPAPPAPAPLPARRPLKTRAAAWPRWIAARLGEAGVSPNAISAASVVWSAGAAGMLVASGPAEGWVRGWWLVGAAAGIQLRLLCNLLDGLVAVEGGRKTPAGEVWNDAPDRLADALVLVAAGYAAVAFPWAGGLGWAAALVAVATAYVRLLGGSLGLAQDFRGPQAKPQRMAVLTLACLASPLEPVAGLARGTLLAAALAVVVLGGLVTIVRRLAGIVRGLEAR